MEAHGGVVFEAAGAAVCAAFAQATDAVAAALAGQLALQGLQGADRGAPGAGAPRARMGLHTGEAERLGGRYAGAPLYRCARLTATAHGGQVVLSGATAALVQDELPGGGCATSGPTGCRTWRAPSGCSSSCTRRCRPTSRRCAPWTRGPTTCPCS